MLDDTCYLLGFDVLGQAAVALGLLNSEVVQDFLKSIVFLTPNGLTRKMF